MQGIGGFVAWVVGLVVLYKLFKAEGLVKALIGFFTCEIYTFIWGWQNIGKEELKLKTWMYVWTGCIVLGVILYVIGGMSGGGQ